WTGRSTPALFLLPATWPKHVNNHDKSADDDGAVGNVEGRIMPCADMKIYEINDKSVHHAVDGVTQRATQDQTQGYGDQALAIGMQAQPDDDAQRHDHRKQGKHPGRGSREQAERCAGIVHARYIQYRQQRDALEQAEMLDHQTLADLIREQDE